MKQNSQKKDATFVDKKKYIIHQKKGVDLKSYKIKCIKKNEFKRLKNQFT